ncbi:MAG: hypothetical protein U0163_11840 [Gemmatimonadaceae bacterium]
MNPGGSLTASGNVVIQYGGTVTLSADASTASTLTAALVDNSGYLKSAGLGNGGSPSNTIIGNLQQTQSGVDGGDVFLLNDLTFTKRRLHVDEQRRAHAYVQRLPESIHCSGVNGVAVGHAE